MTRGLKRLVHKHGLRPFSYAGGLQYVNVYDADVRAEFEKRGARCRPSFKPEAVTNPGRVAWEIRVDRRGLS